MCLQRCENLHSCLIILFGIDLFSENLGHPGRKTFDMRNDMGKILFIFTCVTSAFTNSGAPKIEILDESKRMNWRHFRATVSLSRDLCLKG